MKKSSKDILEQIPVKNVQFHLEHSKGYTLYLVRKTDLDCMKRKIKELEKQSNVTFWCGDDKV